MLINLIHGVAYIGRSEGCETPFPELYYDQTAEKPVVEYCEGRLN